MHLICPTPQISHNLCFSIPPGYYSRPKRKRKQFLCKILEDNQGALWKCGNGELIMLQHKKNLVCVPSPDPVRLAPVLKPALGMAIVKVPQNAALMAVGMFAWNHWVCTLTINIFALKLGVARFSYACAILFPVTLGVCSIGKSGFRFSKSKSGFPNRTGNLKTDFTYFTILC